MFGLLVVLCLAFGLVAARLVWLQVVEPHRYASAGVAQRTAVVTLPADRGSIFDRNGNELAMSVRQATVWADPRLVDDPAATAAALSPVLHVDEATLLRRLTQQGRFVYLARQVPDDVSTEVERLDLPGIALLDEPKRFLPSGELASSVLGSVGIDNDGLSGLEKQYEHLLTGAPGELVIERGIDGRTIAAGEHRLRPAERGSDLVLTIDRALQYETERALGDAVERYSAEGGMAVVMNPTTGEILALANLVPAGDGASAEAGGTVPTGNNMALTDVFEPGSVNKVITLSAALEEGLVEPDTVFNVPDRLQVSTHTYSDHDSHAPADWTVADILANSSNIGTIKIAQQVGKDRLDAYLRAFGFGTGTGLGFPGESNGLVLDTDEWTGTSIGSVPIGNGLAVTAVQMLAAYNVIANDGVYVSPRLVKATVDADGTQREVEPAATRRVVSPQTAEQMRSMMAEVVEGGTGTAAAIDGYTVAGKTGTARKPSRTFRGYEPGAYMSSFAGFVPAESPELSMIVVLDRPTPIYGGVVAAPVFADVASYGLRAFKIRPVPPEEAAPEAPVTEPPASTLGRDEVLSP